MTAFEPRIQFGVAWNGSVLSGLRFEFALVSLSAFDFLAQQFFPSHLRQSLLALGAATIFNQPLDAATLRLLEFRLVRL